MRYLVSPKGLMVLLIIIVRLHSSNCGIVSFNLQSGSEPLSGTTVYLICALDNDQDSIYFYKTGDISFSPGSHFEACSSSGCQNLHQGYQFERTGSSVTVTISALDRTEDQKWWTCRSTNSKQFHLIVYTIPTSMTLQSPSLCDLATSWCSFTCKTVSCTYPEPSFRWFYSIDSDDTTLEPLYIGSTERKHEANGCSDTENNFQESLSLSRNTFIIGNQQGRLRLLCKLQFVGLPTISLASNLSPDVVFAVKVSEVAIYDDGTLLTDDETLTVTEYQQKTLTCVPGYGHPTPTIHWFIGGSQRSRGSTLVFTTTNSAHNQIIYCVADNIPDAVDDAVSGKPKLYVEVKIKYAYIEPAEERTISAIEGIPEPVICVASVGRPHSTINWLKLISGQESNLGEGDNVEHPPAGNNLEMTKSTKEMQISRQDSGWKLSCSAVNVVGSEPIRANNSKAFNVLYPPEQMSISYHGKRVVTATIDVVRGSAVILRCSAVSKPRVDNFSWNLDNSIGEYLTIDNVQTNQMVNCTARNTMKTTSAYTKQGYSSISKEINVLYEATITRITVSVDDTSKNDDTVTVNENDSISISCIVDSNPGSYINLEQSAKLLTQRQHSLELVYNISSAMCSHNSEYTCKAWNGVKTDTPPAEGKLQLNVRCSPRPAIEVDSSVVAQHNTSAALSITLLAYPIPRQYTWYKKISDACPWEGLANSSAILLTHASLQFNLTIKNVKTDDYGEYKLTVENGIGDPYSHVFVLQARGDPEPQSDTPEKDGFTIPIVVLTILLAISLLMNLGFLVRNGVFQTACQGLRRQNKGNNFMASNTEGTQMSTLQESRNPDNSEDSNVSSDHVYDETERRTTNEHAYGSLEQTTGIDEKSYENLNIF